MPQLAIERKGRTFLLVVLMPQNDLGGTLKIFWTYMSIIQKRGLAETSNFLVSILAK